MQAIVVKYLGATNHRGARVKAKCAAGSTTVAYDYAKNGDDNAKAACQRLVELLGWDAYPPTIMGGLPNGDRVFVFAE